MELVNYSLKKDGNNHGLLFSYEKDGASNYTWRIYRWELPDATLDFMQVYDVNTVEFSDGCPVREFDKIMVYTRHIFYDLLDNMIKTYKPSSSAVAASVVQTISSSCLSEHNFTFYSDLDS